MNTAAALSRRVIGTRDCILCALFSALIAVGAFIRIPVPFMDYFTLQFLFVILAGMLLGPRLGAVAAGVYVAVGLVGFPVFAAGGGVQYIFRPSFGYLIGFLAAAFVTGLCCGREAAPSFRRLLAAAYAGMAVTYAIGFAYKFFILNVWLGQPTPFLVVLLSAFPLDIPGDALLCVAGAMLAARLRPALRKERLR